jgi:hypothetical protein
MGKSQFGTPKHRFIDVFVVVCTVQINYYCYKEMVKSGTRGITAKTSPPLATCCCHSSKHFYAPHPGLEPCYPMWGLIYILKPDWTPENSKSQPFHFNREHQYWTAWLTDGTVLDGNRIHEFQSDFFQCLSHPFMNAGAAQPAPSGTVYKKLNHFF